LYRLRISINPETFSFSRVCHVNVTKVQLALLAKKEFVGDTKEILLSSEKSSSLTLGFSFRILVNLIKTVEKAAVYERTI